MLLSEPFYKWPNHVSESTVNIFLIRQIHQFQHAQSIKLKPMCMKPVQVQTCTLDPHLKKKNVGSTDTECCAIVQYVKCIIQNKEGNTTDCREKSNKENRFFERKQTVQNTQQDDGNGNQRNGHHEEKMKTFTEHMKTTSAIKKNLYPLSKHVCTPCRFFNLTIKER